MEQTSPISLRIGANFNPGKVRAENQDRIGRFHSAFGQVFVVADGMGGHEGGATAAQMLIDLLEKHLREVPPGTPPEGALQAAASHTNADIFQRANSGDPKTAQMGATSVIALVRGNHVVVAHAGDSRAYLLRGGQLTRLTRDHTVVQRMVDHNMLSPEEARDHPDASVVTRAFGQKPDVELETSAPFELQSGDRLLLCSDGLCGYVDDERIRQVLAGRGDAQAVADALINLALDAGGEDNVSVQVLAAEGAGERQSAGPPPPAPSPRRGPSWLTILLLVLAGLLLGVLLMKVLDPGKDKKTKTAGSSPGGTEIQLTVPSLKEDKKLIQRLLVPLGVTFQAAGDGLKAGRIYYRDRAKRKADEALKKLKSRGAPEYRQEPWPDDLPPELEEKMQDSDVVIVWQEGEPESAETPPPPSSPTPGETSPQAGPPPPASRSGGETEVAEETPQPAATASEPKIEVSFSEVQILRDLLSHLGIVTRPATADFKEGWVYYRKGFETKARDVVDELNRKAAGKYQVAPWPDKRQGEMPGIQVVVVPHKGKGNQ